MGRCEREIESRLEMIRDAVTAGNHSVAQNYVETVTRLLGLSLDVSKMGAIAAELDQLGLSHAIGRMIEMSEARPLASRP
jgi:hypothetical protein